jgi:hypothetical protein
MLADIVRRMDAANISVAELGLKQPTLDDVFLALTGHTAEQEYEANKSSMEAQQGNK